MTISKTFTDMIDSYPVATSTTIRKGMPCTVSSGIAAETTGTNAWGIALDDADGDVAGRNSVRIHRFGRGIVPLLCAGSINAGLTVKPAADGAAALTVGGATTIMQCLGRLVEAGVTGGLSGCDVGQASMTVGS